MKNTQFSAYKARPHWRLSPKLATGAVFGDSRLPKSSTYRMTLNCCKFTFSRNFAPVGMFGRQQRLNEWK